MPSTYTFTRKSPSTAAISHFGNQPVDGAHVSVQGIGNGIQTQDNTGTPVTSPATVSNSAVTTLITPESAATITIAAITNTVNISEVSTSMTTYFTLPVGTVITLDVADCSALYLKANTGNSGVSFFYTMV